MANPNNNGTYVGKVLKKPIFVHNREGIDFQARWTLCVRRDYKNRKGEYDYDFIPMRLYGDESRLKIARLLEEKDVIIVTGCTVTESYDTKNGRKFNMYIRVEKINFPPRTSYNPETVIREETDFLPFG